MTPRGSPKASDVHLSWRRDVVVRPIFQPCSTRGKGPERSVRGGPGEAAKRSAQPTLDRRGRLGNQSGGQISLRNARIESPLFRG
jgi:hypothetical protein